MTTSALSKGLRLERGIWRSLFHWVTKRPVPLAVGERPFGYAVAAAPAIWVFVGVSAVEIPILDLLLPSWTLRLIFLALGLWGLIWMLGLLGSMHVTPHLVGPSGIRVRNSLFVDLTIPWDAIDSVQLCRRTLPKTRTIQLDVTDSGPMVAVTVSSQVSVEVRLHQPVTVQVPKVGPVDAMTVQFYADDPKALLDCIRELVAAQG